VLSVKACTRCGEVKEFALFVKDPAAKSGFKNFCKTCENARHREQYEANAEYRRAKARTKYAENPIRQLEASIKWREANPEKYAAYLHSWYKENPEKIKRSRMRRNAKARGAGICLVTEKDIKQMKKLPCFYCNAVGYIEIDHVVPIAKGGRHAIGNLVPSCLKCNRSKNNKFVMEWRIWKDKRAKNAIKA
jgi:5-methylcytosine-specific restriction endonuclease McrA